MENSLEDKKNYPSTDDVQQYISKDVKLDQRVYSSPTIDEVVAIWMYVYILIILLKPCFILIFCRSNYYVSVNSPTFDNVSAISRLSSVDDILSQEQKKFVSKESHKKVSCREYNCYKTQIKNLRQSTLLFVGRLLQQYAFYNFDHFDRFVYTKLPHKKKYPKLYDLVAKHMMHGSCGHKNLNIFCVVDGKCKYPYLRPYFYRRRKNKLIVQVHNSQINNQWIYSGVTEMEYLYKYIYKGHNKLAIHMSHNEDENSIDEIKQFQDVQWVFAQEAMWRTFEFYLNERYPIIINLNLHLPNQQCEKKKDVIGRINTLNPIKGERDYLMLLVNHVKGSTSFQNLSKNLIAVATATFEVAAIIILGVRTTIHSSKYQQLKINQVSALCPHGVAELLCKAKLFLWDEPLMKMIRIFCGKVIVFYVDFRQVLQVVLKTTIYQTISASLMKSYFRAILIVKNEHVYKLNDKLIFMFLRKEKTFNTFDKALKQFLIRLCFAMTIKKVRGQIIPHVGVYLHHPIFSHGQLYVALSRGTSISTTKVLIKPDTTNIRENT
ncbi:hypothetical protein Pfo_010049 [Paulownia fortunei]|nr:hypothetical protein Pfo_010049 [Paulownia fortunei]